MRNPQPVKPFAECAKECAGDEQRDEDTARPHHIYPLAKGMSHLLKGGTFLTRSRFETGLGHDERQDTSQNNQQHPTYEDWNVERQCPEENADPDADERTCAPELHSAQECLARVFRAYFIGNPRFLCAAHKGNADTPD